MRRLVAISLYLIVDAIPLLPRLVRCQSLSLGGVSVSVGDGEQATIKRLQVLYRVRFTGTEGMWSVIREDTDTAVVGFINTKGERVSQVTRVYLLESNVTSRDDSLSTLLLRAVKDLRELGGTNCKTDYQEWIGGAPPSLQMTCGAYALSFMPAVELGGKTMTWGLSMRTARVSSGK